MPLQNSSGLEALQRGDYAAAIPLLEESCRNQPDDYDAHMYLGIAYQYAAKTIESIQILTKAVSLQPMNAQARYNLGVAMENASYTKEAAQVYEQALQIQPNYPQASEALARVSAGPARQPAAAPDPASAPSYAAQPPNYSAAQQPTYAATPQPSYSAAPQQNYAAAPQPTYAGGSQANAYSMAPAAAAPGYAQASQTNAMPRCQACSGPGPLRNVSYHQNIGALVMRFTKTIKGDLCENCATKYFWQLTLTTFLLGWWGVVSFIMSPFFIIGNVISYVKGANAGAKALAIAFLLFWLATFSGVIYLFASSRSSGSDSGGSNSSYGRSY